MYTYIFSAFCQNVEPCSPLLPVLTSRPSLWSFICTFVILSHNVHNVTMSPQTVNQILLARFALLILSDSDPAHPFTPQCQTYCTPRTWPLNEHPNQTFLWFQIVMNHCILIVYVSPLCSPMLFLHVSTQLNHFLNPF